MSHTDEQALKLGRMVIGMITDVLTTPAEDEALASCTITTRGPSVILMICKEQKTLSDLEAIVATRSEMVHVHKMGPESEKPN